MLTSMANVCCVGFSLKFFKGRKIVVHLRYGWWRGGVKNLIERMNKRRTGTIIFNLSVCTETPGIKVEWRTRMERRQLQEGSWLLLARGELGVRWSSPETHPRSKPKENNSTVKLPSNNTFGNLQLRQPQMDKKKKGFYLVCAANLPLLLLPHS